MPAGTGLYRRGFRDIVVWRKAIALVVAAHRVADRLPRAQQFGLADQIRRAAVSVAAKIAEGAGRIHRGDFVHHLSIARGSVREAESHAEVVRRLRYVADAELHPVETLCDEISRMLLALIRCLRSGSGAAVGTSRSYLPLPTRPSAARINSAAPDPFAPPSIAARTAFSASTVE